MAALGDVHGQEVEAVGHVGGADRDPEGRVLGGGEEGHAGAGGGPSGVVGDVLHPVGPAHGVHSLHLFGILVEEEGLVGVPGVDTVEGGDAVGSLCGEGHLVGGHEVLEGVVDGSVLFVGPGDLEGVSGTGDEGELHSLDVEVEGNGGAHVGDEVLEELGSSLDDDVLGVDTDVEDTDGVALVGVDPVHSDGG